MPAFRYALQAALDRAHTDERACAVALRDATAMFNREADRLAALDAHVAAVRADLDSRQARPAAALADIDRALVVLDARIANARAAYAHCATVVEQRRGVLAQRRQHRSALERHRARRQAEYDALTELRENTELDEANAFGAATRTMLS